MRVPFFLAQVGQDSINGVLVSNAGDNLHSTPAPAAGLYVNIENTIQALCPCHCRWN
jgi:hypothetical protein